MSTLQHTSPHPVVRTRIALAAFMAAALAALTIALIAAGGGSPNAPVSQPAPAELQQQLDAVNGARFGLTHRSPSPRPEIQLEAVAGARYGQPVGIHTSR